MNTASPNHHSMRSDRVFIAFCQANDIDTNIQHNAHTTSVSRKQQQRHQEQEQEQGQQQQRQQQHQ